MKRYILVAVCLCAVIFNVSAKAQVIYIDVNGPNDPGTGSISDPFKRIQDAVNTAVNSDLLIVQPGIYSGNGNYDIEINGKNIQITSSDPNNEVIVNSTVIDCNRLGRAFYIHGGVSNSCIIEGITIENGFMKEMSAGSPRGGAGILCRDSSSPIIRKCILKYNQSQDNGGAMRIYNGSSPLIEYCTIVGSNAPEGGGISISSSSSPIIKNCLIAGNTALNGAGIDLYFNGLPEIINCTIAGNYAQGKGGAINMLNSSLKINSSIIWGNSANSLNGKQLFLGSGSYLTAQYSDISNDVNDIYNPLHITWGAGSIHADPCFGYFTQDSNFNQWDFHLQSFYGRWNQYSKTWVIDSNISLCIDSGDPNLPYSGEPWQNGFRINMGAYGGTSEESLSGNKGDFDLDGNVDFTDYAYFVSKWMMAGNYIEDFDNNGVVNELDLVIFAEYWLLVNGDINKDGYVNFLDYSLLSGKWLKNSRTIEDMNNDGIINGKDIMILSSYWLWQ